MAYKLIRLLSDDEHPLAMDGIPIPTGLEVEIESAEDKLAAKMLKFIDGTKSVRRLFDDTPMPAKQFAEVIARLFDLGAIAFDQSYCDIFFVEDDGAPVEMAGSDDEEDTLDRHREPESRIDIIEQGDIEETPLWQKFNQLERKMFTGRIIVHTEGCRREFYLLNGALTNAVSDRADEEIGHLLFTRNKLTKAQYEAYKREMARGGVDPFNLLVELGAFPSHQKIMAQRWSGQNAAYNVLKERKGTYVVEQWDRLPRSVPKLGLNFKGVMTKFMEEDLPVDEEADKLKEKMDWWLAPITEKIDRALTEKEQRLWEILVERPRRLRDFMELTTMFKKDTYKFILLLLTGGFAELGKTPPAVDGPIDLRNLDEAYETIMESHYFDVLTVHPVSDFADIKNSYERLIPKFDPAAYRQLNEGQKTKILKMRDKVQKAWEVLRSDDSRRDYRRETFSDYQLRQYAQLQYQKAEIYLWWRHDPTTARVYFGSSMDLDPNNPLYWGAYAFSSISSSTAEAGATTEALRLAERIAGFGTTNPVAQAFAGGTFLRAGRRQQAEALFSKARQAGGATVDSMIQMMSTREK
jgi:curved DNA-binding protein CbpA